MSALYAVMFAEKWHRGLVRTGGAPAIAHLIEVGRILETFHAPVEVVMAGILHDIREDTLITQAELIKEVGAVVANLVEEVTDEYTEVKYPRYNWDERGKLEAGRLIRISGSGQSIKTADMISNARSIVVYDPNFAQVYLPKMEFLLNHLTSVYPLLYHWACSEFHRIKTEFVQTQTQTRKDK